MKFAYQVRALPAAWFRIVHGARCSVAVRLMFLSVLWL